MIDSHAHVGFSRFDEDREAVVGRALEAGVLGWIEVGTDLETSRAAIDLAKRYDGCWAAVGVHPTEVAEVGLVELKSENSDLRVTPSHPSPEATEGAASSPSSLRQGFGRQAKRGRNVFHDSWEQIFRLHQEKKVVAIGEVGLDFYRGGKREEQMPVLEKFIALGVEVDKPLILHMRSSSEVDANEILLAYLEGLPEKKRPRGVMHTFSGNIEQAERFLALGLYLGFSGVITYKNAGITTEVVRKVPIDRILIETDCPFLAPEPWRGKRNEPSYVKYVAEKMADIKGMKFEKVVEITERNTRLLFGV